LVVLLAGQRVERRALWKADPLGVALAGVMAALREDSKGDLTAAPLVARTAALGAKMAARLG